MNMSENHYNCIYKLTAPNGKVYIGQTNDFNRRILEHIRKSDCKKLYGAIKKYGFDSFTQEILVENMETQEELDQLEIQYIQEYDSIENGYNIAIGGCSVKREDGHHIKYGTGKYGEIYGTSEYGKIQYATHKEQYSKRSAEYYKTHKDELTERNKRYREIHKEEIKERKREYYKAHIEEHQERHKKYYEAHKEELKQKRKEYNESHKSENKARCKKYYEAHKEELKETQKKYEETHREKIKEQRRIYREQNREKFREYHREYQRLLRAKKKAIEKHNGQMVLDSFIK